MLRSTRRMLLAGALAAVLATPAGAFEPSGVECIAPANPGGGWDFTCRQVGRALQELGIVKEPVRVTNMAGGGGGVAFAYVVTKRNKDDNLLVAASTATVTRLAQGAYVDMRADMVRWIGTVGADYGVIAVAADSPIKTLGDLMEALKTRPQEVAIAGGSAFGGWDHLKVLIAAKAAGIEDVTRIKYVAYKGGGEAMTALLGGHVQAFSGDISETVGFIEAGQVRVLAVLAPERLPGKLADIPTAREQGVDAIGANWRGFYAPGGMSDEAYGFWVEAIRQVYQSELWQQVMAQSGLMPFALYGQELEAFVRQQSADIAALSREIGLIK